jgi:NADPH:quinone reductase-like Zn-dependent oxidoreductase
MSTTTRATTMTAVAQDHYGSTDVLEVTRMPIPAPGPNDVLVRVRAAGVDVGAWHLMTGRPYLMRVIGFGFRAPKARVRGLAFAGRVESVGSAVTSFAPGDDVVGSSEGAFAEYVAAPETSVTRMPGGVGYEKSAALPISGVTALQAVKAAGVIAGRRALVIGAAGGVGNYVVQLAVAAGATVTGVCSGPKADLVRRLGATEVIDYTRSDITAGDRQWDAIIDTAGNRPLSLLRRALTPTGTLVLVGGEGGGAVFGGVERVAAAGIRNRFTTQKLLGLVSKENATDLAELVGLVEAGTLDPVVDTVYPLAEAAAAVQHIADGRACGKVVLSV